MQKMMVFMKKSICLITCVAGLSGTAFAEDKFAIGFQSFGFTWGVSGKYNVTDKMAIQGIVGNGLNSSVQARGLYAFRKEKFWQTYGIVSAAPWKADYVCVDNSSALSVTTCSDSGVAIGGGVGLEYNWWAFFPELQEQLPPISWNLEMGYIKALNNDKASLSDGFLFGMGVHYQF